MEFWTKTWGRNTYQPIQLIKRTKAFYVQQPVLLLLLLKWRQSCPTLCDPIDGSPPGSLIPGILQARTLEWVAIYFSKVWKWKVKVKSLSCVPLLATPWTRAHQAPLSMGFSRQEYWSGVPLPSPTTACNEEYFYLQWIICLILRSKWWNVWTLMSVNLRSCRDA